MLNSAFWRLQVCSCTHFIQFPPPSPIQKLLCQCMIVITFTSNSLKFTKLPFPHPNSRICWVPYSKSSCYNLLFLADAVDDWPTAISYELITWSLWGSSTTVHWPVWGRLWACFPWLHRGRWPSPTAGTAPHAGSEAGCQVPSSSSLSALVLTTPAARSAEKSLLFSAWVL